MGKCVRYILVNNKYLANLETRRYNTLCIQCGIKFDAGEIIVSKPAGTHGNSRKHYHKECYERLWLYLPWRVSRYAVDHLIHYGQRKAKTVKPKVKEFGLSMKGVKHLDVMSGETRIGK